ncbi:MAG: hypothetical protein M1833_004075 [Piccolia ochrophora]|nr:MAG: hypothetical protein M1833_004075 [Piccolia ochrophora]
MPSTPAAFHTVQARRTFGRPPDHHSNTTIPTSANTIAATPERPKKVDWPQPVRKYVQRAFMPEHNIKGISRDEMESKLKETITQANEKDALQSINWDTLPTPQQLIQNERAQALAVSPSMRRQIEPTVKVGSNLIGNEPVLVDSMSRKRKSSELYNTNADEAADLPPWRKGNNRNGFDTHLTPSARSFGDRLEKRVPTQDVATPSKGSSKSHNANLEKRQRRFETGRSDLSSPKHPWSAREASPVETGPIVGRCQDLEKKYFRLTSAPNPDTVRPLSVLQKTLEHLKKTWKKENNYSYICDQFKSLRQDLTVQHIKNEFTVNVYEIHARIALEKGDLGEYNQCQTQLRALYSQNLGGHPMEFKAYRILYFIHTCNRTDMNDVLADLTTAEKHDRAVKHALDMRSALALGNYHRFFRLYLETPNMGAYLADMFVVRERLASLANICRAYRPDVNLRFITEELGFESDRESVQFLCDNNAQELVEERDEGLRLLTSKAGLLFETAKRSAFRRVDIKGQI